MAKIDLYRFQKKLQLHSMVHLLDSMWCHWGVVIAVVHDVWRCSAMGKETSYKVRRMDSETGKPFVCPDSRCDGGCIICCYGRWADQLQLVNNAEIDLYLETHDNVNILNPEWYKKHVQTIVPKERKVCTTRCTIRRKKKS